MEKENIIVKGEEEREEKAAYSELLTENYNNDNDYVGNDNDTDDDSDDVNGNDDNNKSVGETVDGGNKDKFEPRYNIDKLMNVIFQLKQDLNRLNQEKTSAEENVVKLTEENNTLHEELERAKKLAQSLQLQEQIVLPEVIKEDEAKVKINAENNTPINSYDDIKNDNEREQQNADELKRKAESITDEYKQLESDIIINRDGKKKFIDFMRKREIIFQKMRDISNESELFFQGLNDHYTTIQAEVETVETKTKKLQNKYSDTKQDYMKQIEEAEKAAKQCKKMFEECKKMIDRQNLLLIDKIKEERQLENLQKEQLCIEQLEQQCKELLDSSEESNKKFGQDLINLKKTIDQKFQEVEKNWYEWDSSAVVFFIQKTLNWWNIPEKMAGCSKLEKAMIDKGIEGANLKDLNSAIMVNSLNLNMNDAGTIERTLQQLFKKYPVQIAAEKIPDKFLCAVTGRLMQDPVTVYVGNSKLKELYPDGRLVCDKSSIDILLEKYPDDRKLIDKQIRRVANMNLACEIQEFIQNHPQLETSKKMKGHNNGDEGETPDEGIDTRK